MVGFIITIVVLSISLWLVSLLPIGVEVDSPGKALLGGAVIGILTGLTHFIPGGLRSFGAVISFGLIPFIVSVIIFGLAAKLIEGFRLRNPLSAVIGAVALGLVNWALTTVLTTVGLLPAS